MTSAAKLLEGMILDYIFFKKGGKLMKNLKKLMVLSVTALAITACGTTPAASSEPASSQQPESSEPAASSEPIQSSEESSEEAWSESYEPIAKPTEWERADDNDVYERVLGEFEALELEAKKEKDDDIRFVKYAQAEAALMDAAVFMPTTTQGGNYAITRVAPRTIPYTMAGNDNDRLKNMVVVKPTSGDKNFIKSEDRAALLEQWKAAETAADYDPAAYLTAQGYELDNSYKTTFTTAPATLDILATSMQADTESLVNAIEGLVEYDAKGVMQPKLAKAIPSPVSVKVGEDEETGEDLLGFQYTFEIREDAYWYDADGQQYQKVSADDFVAGFQHMLDAEGGLEWLVEGVVLNVSEYLAGDVDFDQVGYKVVDGKLQVTLCDELSYFLTMLTYSCFMPMNRQFYESKGGKFGADFDKSDANYTYGKVEDVANMVYNSAFIPDTITAGDKILYKKNAAYYDAAKTTLNSILWAYDSGDNPTATYNAAVAGSYSGIGLGSASGTLDLAIADGNFDKYHYITDTNSTTYFGGFNVNRGTYTVGSVKSSKDKDDAAKINTWWAMQNTNFRRALQHAWDRVTHNGVSVGAELAAISLRNIYTAPGFVTLGKDVEFEGHTFAAGTQYGDLVQYFLDKLGRVCNTADGRDGWYNVEEARKYMERAKAQLGEDFQTVQIEVECYAGSKVQVAQAYAFKNSLEGALNYDGQKNVEVEVLLALTTDDYYKAGYRAENGQAGCFDVFYGSGWGPDFGDPCSYLDTFLGGGAGYMTKVIGLF